MSMDKLVTSLLSDAKKEADEIVKTAEWHVEKLLTEEKAKRVVLLKNAEEEVATLLKSEEKERFAWAKLESKRVIAEAKEDALKAAMDSLVEKLDSFRKTKSYPLFIKKAAAEGCRELGGEQNCIIHMKKGEKKHLLTKAKVVEDLEGLGGVLVETLDGKIRVNSTLESLLDSRREFLRKEIYSKLFGD